MHGTSRSRVAFISLALAAMAVPACKPKADQGKQEVEQAKASATQSLGELKAQIATLQKAESELRAKFNGLPEDVLPGLDAVRSKLFAVEEVMGVEGGRAEWLAGELTTAVASGDKDQIQKVSDTIRGAIVGSTGMAKAILDLTHQLLPFEEQAARYRALLASGEIVTRLLPTGYKFTAAKDGLEKNLSEFIDDPKVKVDKKTWFTFDHVSFGGEGSMLNVEQSKDQLDIVAELLRAFPRVKLEIGGFTDNAGPAATNRQLSAERAAAVKARLVTLGVDAARLTAQGFGPAQPLCPRNDTDACKAKNRRVAVRVVAK